MQFPISRAPGREGKSIVFGTNPHHPGSQTPADPPRLRDIEATYIVDGQEGRLACGRSPSAAANTQEPFAWAIASDNKTIVGAVMDGYFRITLISLDSIDKVLHPQRHQPDPCDRRHLAESVAVRPGCNDQSRAASHDATDRSFKSGRAGASGAFLNCVRLSAMILVDSKAALVKVEYWTISR
jgi:hypothetical protein